jgi:hypothetical protein
MTTRMRVLVDLVEYNVIATSNTTITYITDDGPCEIQRHHCKLVEAIAKVRDFTKRPRINLRVRKKRNEIITVGGQELLTINNTIEQWVEKFKQLQG